MNMFDSSFHPYRRSILVRVSDTREHKYWRQPCVSDVRSCVNLPRFNVWSGNRVVVCLKLGVLFKLDSKTPRARWGGSRALIMYKQTHVSAAMCELTQMWKMENLCQSSFPAHTEKEETWSRLRAVFLFIYEAFSLLYDPLCHMCCVTAFNSAPVLCCADQKGGKNIWKRRKKLWKTYKSYNLFSPCDSSSFFLPQAIYDMLGACSSNKPADSAEERAKNIFAKMDENNDGQLTQDEFLKGCLQDEELSKMLAP